MGKLEDIKDVKEKKVGSVSVNKISDVNIPTWQLQPKFVYISKGGNFERKSEIDER